MSSFVNALKDRVVGVVEENVGYLTGNADLEARGREKREHGAEEASTFYEKSGNISSPRNPEGTSFEAPDSTASSESSTSFNPSLFARNQPDPENSAHGAVQYKLHSDPVRQSSMNTDDKPNIAPIQSQESFFEGSKVEPLPERKASEDKSSSWMDKLGAIMGGTKEDETTLLRSNETKKEEEMSVMDRLRNAHGEAIAQQQEKGITESIKEKFDNWNKSTSGKVNERGFSDTVQEKVEEVKDKVESYLSPDSAKPDPLLMKPTPVGGAADVPDTNFLQNA